METRDQVYGGAWGFPSDVTFTCHHAVLFDDRKVHTFHLFDLLLHHSASPWLHKKCQGDLAEMFRVGRTWSRISEGFWSLSAFLVFVFMNET